MFGLGSSEIIVILIIALLVFGPARLPEIGKKLGDASREFRKMLAQITQPVDEMKESEEHASNGEHRDT